jgi:GTP-binding protein YchF
LILALKNHAVSMELGIAGLPKSGKTTVFQALTRGKGEKAAHPSVGAVYGMVKVPDPRLWALAEILKPKRTIPAEVKYIDIGVPLKGLGAQYLAPLSTADALIHVVRVFEDQSVPHIEGSIDPERDINTVNLELILSDLAITEKRLERLNSALRGAKPQEREANLREQALLQKIKSALENEVPIREQGLTEQEAKSIENYQLLSAKPMLLLLNIGEEQIPQAATLKARFQHHSRPHCDLAVLCSKLEMELAELSGAEAEEFRTAMGLDGSWLEQVLRLSFRLLDLISFFSIASDEVKAWAIAKNTTAQKAAGKVHTDMERGFIRAEVIGHNELITCGSTAEARKRGLLRLEGKNYIVQDGDVLTILFHI